MIYTSKLKDKRFVPVCIVNKNGNFALVDTLFDTGALYTCYNISSLRLNYNDIKHCKKKYINGIDDKTNSVVTLYEYRVTQFIIGNLNLGTQTIWVSPDNSLGNNVLGMDIISRIGFIKKLNEDKLYIYNDVTDFSFNFNCIKRKVFKDKKGYYIEYSNMQCYFKKEFIKYTNNQPYIMIGYQKILLDFS